MSEHKLNEYQRGKIAGIRAGYERGCSRGYTVGIYRGVELDIESCYYKWWIPMKDKMPNMFRDSDLTEALLTEKVSAKYSKEELDEYRKGYVDGFMESYTCSFKDGFTDGVRKGNYYHYDVAEFLKEFKEAINNDEDDV